MISAVITGAGSSERFGKNKMLQLIGGKPLIMRTVEQFEKADVDEIIVTARKEDIETYENILPGATVVEGGPERIISLYNGVKKCSGDIIITHDGARPLVPAKLIKDTIDAVKEYGAAMTAVNPTATVKLSDESMMINDTLPRKNTWIAQTPQGFKKEIIIEALEKAIGQEYFLPTDDSEIVAKMTGKKIRIVPGDDINMKVTYPSDIKMANAIFGGKKLVGVGIDSHGYDPEKKLVLGGIEIPDEDGLEGNSDADVVIHAICNALCSAVGRGSISTYSDEMCRSGITDSREYLKKAMEFVREKGYGVNNVSAAIEAKKPKLEHHFPEMKKALSKILETQNIGLTATSGEGLTSFGRGVKVIAAVSLK